MTSDDPEPTPNRRFDVALSFAGEQRDFVEGVADVLRSAGLSVFYDSYHEVELWGKDLYAHLDRVYREEARYCVLFLSADYAEKVWTRHERRSAQARAIREHMEYVLPVRFDGTEIDGIPETIGYIDVRERTPEDIATLTLATVGSGSRPTISDGLDAYRARLAEALAEDTYWLGVADSEDLPGTSDGHEFRVQSEEHVTRRDALNEGESEADPQDDPTEPPYACVDDWRRWRFLARLLHQQFTSLSEDERVVVGTLLAYGCPSELPALVHIDPVELERLTHLTQDECLRHLAHVRSLGFDARRRAPAHAEPDEIRNDDEFDITLSWWCSAIPDAKDATVAAEALLTVVVAGCCYEHGIEKLRHCDFSGA